MVSLKNGCSKFLDMVGERGQEKEEKEDSKDEEDLQDLLCHLFPCRTTEIRALLALLGGPSDPLPPLLVYGGASTGKTAIAAQLFEGLGRPYALASCRSCHTPRLLFESLLNQLLAHTRTASNRYESAKKCDKLSDFVTLLPLACCQALNANDLSKKGPALRDKTGRPEDVETHEQLASVNGLSEPTAKMVYLIIDNVELLLRWAAGFRIISALLRLPELTGISNVGVIFIGNIGPDALYQGTGASEPVPIFFRDYVDDELFQILVKKKPRADLYSSFLSAVLKPFTRATRRVTELSEVLEPLFQKYIEPIHSGVVKPDDQGKRKLFGMLKPHIAPALNQTCSFSEFPLAKTFSKGRNDISEKAKSAKKAIGMQLLEETDFQLSLCSKYLLLSAFLCSRNLPTLDATLFDSGGAISGRKRQRKSSQTSIEKKDQERQEKLLKGPGTFPLERLLAIFSCISDEMDSNVSDVANEDTHGMEITADVLMQLTTLMNANLLSKGSSDPLEGSTRYRCNADEDLVQKVARSISFPLSRYLHH